MTKSYDRNVRSFIFGNKGRPSDTREILRKQSSHLDSNRYSERPSFNDDLSLSNTQWQRSRKKIFPILRLDDDQHTTQYPPLATLIHTAEEENIYKEIKKKQLDNNSSVVHDVYEDVIMPKFYYSTNRKRSCLQTRNIILIVVNCITLLLILTLSVIVIEINSKAILQNKF